MFLFSMNFIFSGTVQISGLTDTTNPGSVQRMIDQNIHKKGYEKAYKEFLDEKRKNIQCAQEKSSARPLRSSSRLRSQMQKVEKSKPAKPHELQLHAVSLKSGSRLCDQIQIVETTKTKPAKSRQIRSHAIVAESNPHTTVTLRSSSRLNDKMPIVEITKTNSSKPREFRSRAVEPESNPRTLRSSNRLRGQMPTPKTTKAGPAKARESRFPESNSRATIILRSSSRLQGQMPTLKMAKASSAKARNKK